MYAIEFQTKITDGKIEVPAEYSHRLTGAIRVIILTEEPTPDMDMIEYLLKNPIKAPGFIPMKREEIYQR